MIGCIYMITCDLNGKRYIGESLEVMKRMRKHFLGCTHRELGDKKLYQDIMAYGSDCFSTMIIEAIEMDDKVALKRKLLERESWWILELNTYVDGYNDKVGAKLSEHHKKAISVGNTGRPCKEEVKQQFREEFKGENGSFYGRHHTKESMEKKRVSWQSKDRSLSDDRKKELSVLFSGENNPFYGRHHTEESKAKITKTKANWTEEQKLAEKERISKMNTGRYIGGKSVRAAPIRCVETGIEYDSISTAARELGLPTVGNIANACKKGCTCSGYHWEYVDREKPSSLS